MSRNRPTSRSSTSTYGLGAGPRVYRGDGDGVAEGTDAGGGDELDLSGFLAEVQKAEVRRVARKAPGPPIASGYTKNDEDKFYTFSGRGRGDDANDKDKDPDRADGMWR